MSSPGCLRCGWISRCGIRKCRNHRVPNWPCISSALVAETTYTHCVERGVRSRTGGTFLFIKTIKFPTSSSPFTTLNWEGGGGGGATTVVFRFHILVCSPTRFYLCSTQGKRSDVNFMCSLH
jgi:hypothetical protein